MTGLIYAFAWPSGKIDFGAALPVHALPILKGPEIHVREVVMAAARRPDMTTLLVPGMSAERLQNENLQAAFDFIDLCMAKIHELREAERKSSCLH